MRVVVIYPQPDLPGAEVRISFAVTHWRYAVRRLRIVRKLGHRARLRLER